MHGEERKKRNTRLLTREFSMTISIGIFLLRRRRNQKTPRNYSSESQLGTVVPNRHRYILFPKSGFEIPGLGAMRQKRRSHPYGSLQRPWCRVSISSLG